MPDTFHKLDWQGCAAGLSGTECAAGSAGSYKWKEALAYCEGLSYGGHTDWRLPNVVELQSIVDHRLLDPSIDPVIFPATPSTDFWTSSSIADYLLGAWGVYFDFGDVIGGALISGDKPSGEKLSGYRVRCVRSGP